MLAQRRTRWANISPALRQRVVCAEMQVCVRLLKEVHFAGVGWSAECCWMAGHSEDKVVPASRHAARRPPACLRVCPLVCV